MTRGEFLQIKLGILALAVMIAIAFAHGVYVDYASCVRNNAVRVVEAQNLTNAADTVKSLTPARRAQDRADAKKLSPLDCSIPIPETP